MFAAWVARKIAVSSMSFTMTTIGVPGGVVAAIRPASVAAAEVLWRDEGLLTRPRRRGSATRAAAIRAAVAGQAIHSGTRASRIPSAQAIPRAASTGRANPNVMMRSGGNHPDQIPIGTPTIVSSAHATRNRRVNPCTRGIPAAAKGQERPGAYRLTFSLNRSQVGVREERLEPGSAQEGVLRRIDSELRRPDQHREESGAHDRAAAGRGDRDAAGV